MTIVDAICSMNFSNRNAVKRGMMGGYVWKFRVAKNGLTELSDDNFRVSLVQRDGDQYIYSYVDGTWIYNGKVAAGASEALDNLTAPTVADTLDFGAELFGHVMTGDDWQMGAQLDFEDSRTGAGEW